MIFRNNNNNKIKVIYHQVILDLPIITSIMATVAIATVATKREWPYSPGGELGSSGSSCVSTKEKRFLIVALPVEAELI